MARISRRAFLSRSAAAALAVTGGVLLQGCGKRDPTGAAPGAAGPRLASPENPVTWPIKPGNEPIAANLPAERGATPKVYNSARSSPTPALNALASIMLASSLLAVALGALVYRRFTRGERGARSAVEELAGQV